MRKLRPFPGILHFAQNVDGDLDRLVEAAQWLRESGHVMPFKVGPEFDPAFLGEVLLDVLDFAPSEIANENEFVYHAVRLRYKDRCCKIVPL